MSKRFMIVGFVLWIIANTAVTVFVNVEFRPWLQAHIGARP